MVIGVTLATGCRVDELMNVQWQAHWWQGQNYHEEKTQASA